MNVNRPGPPLLPSTIKVLAVGDSRRVDPTRAALDDALAVSAGPLAITAAFVVTPLGLHDVCEGVVVFIACSDQGFRLCHGCGARGPDAQLMTEIDIEMVEVEAW